MIAFTIFIPKLLIKLDIWLGIIDISNTRHAQNKIDEELKPIAWQLSQK